LPNFHSTVRIVNKYEPGQYQTDSGIDLEAKNPWRWLPLELYEGGSLTKEADTWSFGVTCWEMFAGGKIPYTGQVNFQSYLHRCQW